MQAAQDDKDQFQPGPGDSSKRNVGAIATAATAITRRQQLEHCSNDALGLGLLMRVKRKHFPSETPSFKSPLSTFMLGWKSHPQMRPRVAAVAQREETSVEIPPSCRGCLGPCNEGFVRPTLLNADTATRFKQYATLRSGPPPAMAVLPKPIPPLYTVYILRSTVRHASLYIGSTPHPPRRLKQHNGEAKGGAARTSRSTLRPWEMVGLVSGFPGMVAALKFEWALTNPHLSLHIPSTSRISVATQKKRNGHPKRPRHSLTSILSNLHLLLRVPSFARWPLSLHFFSEDAHKAWAKWCSTANEPVRDTIAVFTDFEPARETTVEAEAAAEAEPSEESGHAWGIHALPLDYTPLKEYVTKTNSIFTFERQGDCIVCGESMAPGEGLYATCSNVGCEGVGHVACWGQHLLGNDGDEVIPIAGQCPECHGAVKWGDMMKETTLRMRGAKEVDKLLKKPRKRKAAAVDT
ncbi:hypothetical protein JX266_011675 [Neoarthrinium moseri]|nr:hypothetical protein JX266_011675 [Neoarthrinium moseri]